MTAEKVSERSKRYIELAKAVPYSAFELDALKDILYEMFLKELREGIGDVFQELYLDLTNYIRCGFITDTLDESHVQCEQTEYMDTRYYELNYMQYLLINHRKVFLFLTHVPIDQVPLYLNDPKLEPFAKWRLTIAK